MMDRSDQEGTQTDQLRVYEDFVVLRPVEEHEADVKDEGVDSQDETVDSHILLLEGNHNPEEGVQADHDQKIYRI